ncbi:MAG: 50S ribosomal protein L13 [Candidatus Woesearchaeota archaeon]
MATINAKDLIAGRLATVVAKRALLGEKINIVNSEQTIIIGKKESIIKKYKELKDKGYPFKGPFFQTLPDRFLRRMIRGMLPYKQERGLKAFKNIMCYLGIPKEFKSEKLETIKNVHISKSKATRFTTIGEVCKALRK